MTMNQLKYFLAVARCLSFTEAARSLFMTQPALSRQIKAMETELGTPLFVREKKTLKLTPGGSALYNKLPNFLRWGLHAVYQRKICRKQSIWRF